MAQIIRKSDALYRKYKAMVRKSRIWFLMGGISIAIAFFLHFIDNPLALGTFVLGLILFFIGSMMRLFYARERAILKTGIQGEERCARIIAQLPNTYYGFQNVEVSYEGKKSELDMVVVGPTGIIIVEVKNLNGIIQGSEQSHQWTQYKIGRGGTPYSSEFHSPVKQVGTHVYRLAHYLRQRSCRFYVDGIVFFTNPDVSLRLKGDFEKIPVLAITDGQRALCRCIQDREVVLMREEIEEVCRVLRS